MAKEKLNTDVLLKEFWRQNDRFADLFNAVFFEGKQVLRPEQLQETDTDVSGSIRIGDYGESLKRSRDVVKKSALGADFAVLGIESQTAVHYAMPLRTMLYDGLGYMKEYQEISATEKRKKYRNRGEFLSGMRKDDRLHPVFTTVIFYGEDPWDGPMSLKDMMCEMPPEFAEAFSDYRMNLLQVTDSGKYSFQNQEVESLFEISREIFKGNIEGVTEKYRDVNLSRELRLVLGKITNTPEFMNEVDGEEDKDMCRAMEEYSNRIREEGVLQTKQAVIRNLLKLDMSFDTIAEVVELGPDEVIKAAAMTSV